MPPTKTVNTLSPCPCGSHKTLGDCCLPYVLARQAAPTAELLMRSRYTAHALVAVDYLWETWAPSQRVQSSKNDIREWAESCEWLKLEIISTVDGTENDNEGLVTFIASYSQDGKIYQHHEISLFKKIEGHWLYISHFA